MRGNRREKVAGEQDLVDGDNEDNDTDDEDEDVEE